MTLPDPPKKNERVRMTHGLPVVNGKEKTFKRVVKEICEANKLTPLEGAIEVEALFYFQPRRDIDSGWSSLLDALQGCLYSNDNQIIKATQYRFVERIFEPYCIVRVRHYETNQPASL